MVSQEFAERLFPGESAVGKLVWGESDAPPVEIIGVYDLMMSAWVHEPETYSTALSPWLDAANEDLMYLIRADQGQLDAVMAEAEALLSQTPGRLLRISRTMKEQKNRAYSRDNAMVRMLSGVVVALIVVTGFGIVGLASFSVTPEAQANWNPPCAGRDEARYPAVLHA